MYTPFAFNIIIIMFYYGNFCISFVFVHTILFPTDSGWMKPSKGLEELRLVIYKRLSFMTKGKTRPRGMYQQEAFHLEYHTNKEMF